MYYRCIVYVVFSYAIPLRRLSKFGLNDKFCYQITKFVTIHYPFNLSAIVIPTHSSTLLSKNKYNITGHYDISGQQWFTFKVKGCRDAIVDMLSNGKKVYQAMFGHCSNLRSFLNDANDTTLGWKWTNPTLDCNNYRSFWVSWNDGKIQSGKGLNRGQNVWMSTVDTYNGVKIDDLRLRSYYSQNKWQVRQGML